MSKNVTASYGTILDFIAFFKYLPTLLMTVHVWSIVSLPNFPRLYDFSIHTFWYIDMPDVTTSNGRFSGLIGFFGNFNVWSVILS